MANHVMQLFRKAALAMMLIFPEYDSYAQGNIIDSLKNLLPSASAYEQIRIDYEIGAEWFDSSPDSANEYYNKCLSLARETSNDTFVAKCLNRIGILQFNSGDYDKSIGNLFSALHIFEQQQDSPRTIRCLQYLAMAYNEQGMYDKAIDFAKQSLQLSRAIDDPYSTSVGMSNMGSAYYAQADYDKALVYFQNALHIMEEIDNRLGIPDALNNVALIYEKKNDLAKALEYHLRSLALAKEIGDIRGIAASYHNIGLVYKGMKNYSVAMHYLDSCIVLAKKGDNKFFLKESYNTLSDFYAALGKYEMAFQTHVLYSKLNDTLLSEENKKQFAEMNTRYETAKKDNQIGLLNKQREIQSIVRNALTGGFVITLLFAGTFFWQRNKVKKGKQISDTLLLNILPEEVADELKAKGSAEAKQFDEVTVMFADIKDFTLISERLSPTELVYEIHTCFKTFDEIITRHNIEKIKTIGDAYMCAGGLPVVNTTHAIDIVKAALEIRDFMNQRVSTTNTSGENPVFEIRIGIHTGPVVAGIVGVKKFAYDIWGDTVNIAARMESSGEPGKVNISASTYALVKEQFSCMSRGKIQAKHKGEIEMFFVK